MNNAVKTRPDRYLEKKQARAYHRSTNSANHPRLSQRLELAALGRAIDSAANTGATGSVVDVPCGTGRIDTLLRQRFDHVTGLDSSIPMLSVYRQTGTDRAAGCADIFNLPFADGSFDWAVCHRYIHHLHSRDERVRALASIRRISRSGVIFYTWLNTPVARRSASMRTSISVDELTGSINDSGLRQVSTHYCAWPFSVKAIVVCAHRKE